MEPKKKLIGRLAVAAGVVLALSLAVLAGATLVGRATREDRLAHAKREREALVERSRKYVGELAHRVDRVPVDPALVGEIEARYFEEYASGPMQVWAMGTDGRFLFGVPREAFDKLNAIYDQSVAPNLQEGVFVDRQTFLRTLADASEEIGPRSFASEPSEDDGGAWERWRRLRHDPQSSFVVAAPLRSGSGAALGSLYLKRTAAVEREAWQGDDLREAREAAGVAAGLAAAFLWLLLPTWVFVDARGRGLRRAWLFAFLTALSAVVGLVVYLIARPEVPAALSCPGCSREVDGNPWCPHCGHDLSAAFCAACRYPLKPDWAFCPACRTEIRARQAQPEPAPPAPEPAG
jgi:hypothetical protein